MEVVLGPLFVFLAYDDVPSKWTLIGGTLLLVVLAVHESRPLFEKAQSISRRISSRMGSRISKEVCEVVEASNMHNTSLPDKELGDVYSNEETPAESMRDRSDAWKDDDAAVQ